MLHCLHKRMTEAKTESYDRINDDDNAIKTTIRLHGIFLLQFLARSMNRHFYQAMHKLWL